MNEKPINILLIEDNEDDIVYIQEVLADIKIPAYRLSCRNDLGEGIEWTRKHKLDVVLLDLSLPDSWGTGTVSRFRKEVSDLPIIVLTSLDDEEIGIKTIQEGAQDYIVKRHISSYTIRQSIRYAIERQKLITNIKKLKGLLPICSKCKNIRNDEGYWQKVEEYISQHSDADFSHSLCPDCINELYPEFADK